jgi:hypothetical protein
MVLVLLLDSDTHSFLLRVTDTDSDTDDITSTNFTQWTDNTNCRPTIPVVHRFTGYPTGLCQTEPPHINKEPSPLNILMARQGRQAPSTGQLKRLNTRHNRHWLMQCKRIWCRVCSAKNKKQEQNSSVENAT